VDDVRQEREALRAEEVIILTHMCVYACVCVCMCVCVCVCVGERSATQGITAEVCVCLCLCVYI
jgi:hypothetical protein